MPERYLSKTRSGAIPLTVIEPGDFTRWRKSLTPTERAWVKSNGFDGRAGSHCLLAGSKGALDRVVIGGVPSTIWEWSAVARVLPPGRYSIGMGLENEQPETESATTAAMGWALAGYAYTPYKAGKGKGNELTALLVWPRAADRAYVLAAVRAICLVRDLINVPANDMGPTALAQAASKLARKHKATFRTIVGKALLKQNYPAIHAVGRASTDAPRLIDMKWGKRTHPKVTLVGKGVCFDSGGLDIKSAAGMKLMKKDMGGAANTLGLASMIMERRLPVRLRLLIPAVENSIAGNAMRPGDVLPTRSKLTIEVGNTDAEGRVILADALTEAVSESPDVVIDFATLTGAARVALGTEVPALFSNDNDLARELMLASERTGDPLWHMPLWHGYKAHVNGKVADLNNAPEGGYGGAITAALFLEHFVNPVSGPPPSWCHVDMMAWNLGSRPGRPEGGEAMGIRAFFDYLSKQYG